MPSTVKGTRSFTKRGKSASRQARVICPPSSTGMGSRLQTASERLKEMATPNPIPL